MKKLSLTLCILFCCGILFAQEMTVATYNLRNANRGDSIAGNGWGQRYPVIARLIQFQGFDIFGTQEGKYHQLQDLKNALPGYDYIGIGRDDGKKAGEHSAIFYRTDRFEVLDHGDFWLSTQTDKPNKGWDAVLPRICSWGEFKDKKSGFRFLFFNLHMDHVGVIARSESAKLILQKIREHKPKLPAILTGDFNVDQNSDSYKVLNDSGIMKDSYEKADFIYATNGTFNDFKTDAKTDERIDHIFLTPEFEVKKYGILTDTYRSPSNEPQKKMKSGNFPKEVSLESYVARTPSDHFPVMVIVNYDKK
ncbi:endonuclease/exonuclease/phosphatase family protein [Coprobacter tertius]|uniref:Endonuclease/exonuclease/phosphatase family protein n=1 Tax=Coprobacter tertius TaxID=2944915 RepID=A0ABT1MLR9_9BACT|nr:endonuclease/exonuclease/phosphatase family protein [Coprobacter tertius]MCP9612668.1 endonuclease/exonuclease/phosphatase family protein [Coprobacter tertius]